MTDRTKSSRQRDLKLELTWVGKDHRPRIEPRILLEDPERHYHAAGRVTDHDEFENKLIFGDNLLALQSLVTNKMVAGKVKCIYIDPPFNTGEMFEYYDDGLEHSIWLGAMRDRIEILHQLLSDDGSLFVHIDDNEIAYLIAICDEIFGRNNRISIITFKQSSISGPKSVNPGLVKTTSYVIYYAKNKKSWSPNKVYSATGRDSRYSSYLINPEDPPEKWKVTTLRNGFAESYGKTPAQLKKDLGSDYEKFLDDFVLENAGRVLRLARVQPKDVNAEARNTLADSLSGGGRFSILKREDKSDYVFYNGQQVLFYSNKVRLIDGSLSTGEVLSNLWVDVLSNNLHNEGAVSFPDGKKPEALLKRILEIATNPGDLVLDSFAGSGTTGAVAHKMGRKWIMVELGEHAHTHIIPRMQKVIDGTDQGGISQAVGWQGGGGFRYYKLAPSLIKKDKRGNEVINPEYNPEMLAEASCKLKGFTFAPSESRELWWQQGRSSERDFLYVTTQYMDYAALQDLSEEVGPDRTLLVLCKAFDRAGDTLPNLTIEKIPDSVLHLAEWDHDDYSLKVENLPKAEPKPEPVLAAAAKAGRKGKAQMVGAAGLFDEPVTDAGGDS